MVYRPPAVPRIARSASPFVLGIALSACGAAAPRRPDPGANDANAAIAKLQREAEAQSNRVAELEARLALLEADARQWRETAATPAAQKSTETVRISAAQRRERQEAADDDVPLVRLHEAEPVTASIRSIDDAPLALPPRPIGVAARLPVVPLPEQRAGKLLTSGAGGDADARERYRQALRQLREGHFDAAGEALSAFLDVYPAHALSAGATYWLGEVRYAQRRYDDALQQFKAVLAVFPDSDKRAGSLLKAGLCQKRLGDEDAARRYFEQLREQFPNSDAARIASREGSS